MYILLVCFICKIFAQEDDMLVRRHGNKSLNLLYVKLTHVHAVPENNKCICRIHKIFTMTITDEEWKREKTSRHI